MTTDHDALLAAILAQPDDDLARLVFADYLDESGHPALAARAAFIRAQVEAARHPVGSAARLERTRRAGELRPRFRDEWDEAFPPAGGELDGTTVVRDRGFVDEVRADLGVFLTLGQQMVAVAPVRTVAVGGGGSLAEWPAFVLASFLTGVRGLRLGPRLAGLTETRTRGGRRLPASALSPLLACRHLSALQRLDLSANDLDDTSVVRFTAGFDGAAFADGLRELDLGENGITDAGAHTLAAGRGLDRLDRLVLTGNRVSGVGAGLLRRRFGERVVL